MATTTKSKKYFDRINQTEEELAKEQNKLKAEGAHLALQQRMLEIKKSIADNEIAIDREKANTNYQPSTIYAYQNKIDLLQREFKFYEELEKEQF